MILGYKPYAAVDPTTPPELGDRAVVEGEGFHWDVSCKGKHKDSFTGPMDLALTW